MMSIKLYLRILGEFLYKAFEYVGLISIGIMVAFATLCVVSYVASYVKDVNGLRAFLMIALVCFLYCEFLVFRAIWRRK